MGEASFTWANLINNNLYQELAALSAFLKCFKDIYIYIFVSFNLQYVYIYIQSKFLSLKILAMLPQVGSRCCVGWLVHRLDHCFGDGQCRQHQHLRDDVKLPNVKLCQELESFC